MNAATSPVKAPSFLSVAQSCPATLIFDPSKRSAMLFSAVNTGAMITSQWLALAIRGFKATAVATESPTVLYIFQFPAITGLRISLVGVLLAAKKIRKRNAQALRRLRGCGRAGSSGVVN